MTTFIICASGPSLNISDCQLALNSGHQVMAVNSSFQMVPGCHYIYAADRAWWDQYYPVTNFGAPRWTSSVLAANRYSLKLFRPKYHTSFNSGQRAIQLAVELGAERILLLGFDCSIANGTHWHGDHLAGLKNPDDDSVNRWKSEFQFVADHLPPGTEVINCSRSTELTCFPRLSLEMAVGQLSLHPGRQRGDLSHRTM